MSEIRKIEVNLDKDILYKIGVAQGYKIEEVSDRLFLKKKGLYRNIEYYNGQLIYDSSNINEKNKLLNEILKEQMIQNLYKEGITNFDVIENDDEIQILVRRD